MLLRLVAGAACVMSLSVSAASAGPIHDAARAGDLAAVTRLLGSGGLLEERDATAETPLIAAALAGQTPIVLDLIKRGADVKARNDRGMTALHAAAFAGDVAAVGALLTAGLNVNDADNKFGVTPLIVAAEEGHGDLVRLLIDHGGGIEITEAHGYTVLSRAGFKNRGDIVAFLLKHGAVCQEGDPSWFKECTKRKAELGL